MNIKLKTIIILVPLIALSLSFCSMPGKQSTRMPEKPNIILILADDIGYGDFKPFNPASKLDLPNIELLAENGIIFTDAHSPSSLCAPTRYSVMTGNYPWRGRLIHGTWGYSEKSQVLEGQQSIGQLMKNAGYNTAMFGKYHLGGEFYSRENPEELLPGESDFRKLDFSRRFRMGALDLGFDYSWILPSGIQNIPFAHFENDKLVGDPAHLKILPGEALGRVGPNGRVRPEPIPYWNPPKGLGMPYWDPYDIGPIMTGKTIDFMKRHWEEDEQGNQPFFIYYCSQAIHVPICPADSAGNTPVKGTTFDPVGDFILELDATLGMLIDAVEQSGELDNTLIIITSDNGAWPHRVLFEKGHNPNAPLAGWKGQMWEGGHRVPFIASWGLKSEEPVIPHGLSSSQLMGLQDLYATFAELTGQSVEEGHGLDSHSFLPALLGEKQSDPRRYLAVQARFQSINDFSKVKDLEGLRAQNRQGSENRVNILRDNEWKLIVGTRKRRDAPAEIDGKIMGFYNLNTDPLEQSDLKDDPGMEERISGMYEKYTEIMTSKRSVAIK